MNNKLKNDFAFASAAVAVSMVLYGSAYAQNNDADNLSTREKTSLEQKNTTATKDSSADTKEQTNLVNKTESTASDTDYSYAPLKRKNQALESFDDNNSEISTTLLKGVPLKHDKQVEKVATKIMETMSYPVTLDYLKNQNFADSATFPSRLIQKINSMPSTTAPRSPITGNAVSCFYGVPPYREPEQFDVNTTPIQVTADSVTGKSDENDKKQLVYEGKVHITQGDKTIDADKATYSESPRP